MKITQSKSYTVQEGDMTAAVNPDESRVVLFVNGSREAVYMTLEQTAAATKILNKILESEQENADTHTD